MRLRAETVMDISPSFENEMMEKAPKNRSARGALKPNIMLTDGELKIKREMKRIEAPRRRREARLLHFLAQLGASDLRAKARAVSKAGLRPQRLYFNAI
jgi:hypothetical protein